MSNQRESLGAIIIEDEPLLQEKCGLVAMYHFQGNPLSDPSLFFQTLKHAGGGVQHRGQHGWGTWGRGQEGVVHKTGNGKFAEMPEDVSLDMSLIGEPTVALLHARYGTFGDYEEDTLQPCLVSSQEDQIAVIHNGEFVAIDQMRARLLPQVYREGISDTYLFTKLLSQAEGSTWDEKVQRTLDNVDGAYSLCISIGDSLYITRDPRGIRPLFIGNVSGDFIAASETMAMDKVHATGVVEVPRGGLIKIDQEGVHVLRMGEEDRGNFCDFELPYFSHPQSQMPTYDEEGRITNREEWDSIAMFRERCGAILAEESSIADADFVIGVPDSGNFLATGVANALRLPYRQLIVRDHYDPNGGSRLFQTDDDKEHIGSKVLGKLILNPDKRVWAGKTVVVGDDSIVRGNVAIQLAKALYLLGVSKIYFASGFPMVSYPCHLGVSMRTESELLAKRNQQKLSLMIQEIREKAELPDDFPIELKYISWEGFEQAKNLNGQVVTPDELEEIFLANGGCGGCVTGRYPVSKEGIPYQRRIA